METINIKQLNKTEAHLVINLFNQYRIFYKQDSNIELATKFIQARLDNNESIIFVAFIKEDEKLIPIGFTQLYPLYSSVSAMKNWILNDLYVEQSHRKKGIGEKLIKVAMNFAKENNAKIVQLETMKDNYTAQKLYETIGFKKHDPHQNSIVYQIEV
jgi:ribosomal protein S18 acetylase RimI-like enzyme